MPVLTGGVSPGRVRARSVARVMTSRRPGEYRQVMDVAWYPRALSSGVLLAAGALVAFSEPGFDPYHHDSGTLWAAAGVLGAIALAWRRVSPRIVWLIATATGTWLLFTRHGPDWGGLSPLVLIPSSLVALGTLASRTARRDGLIATAATLATLEAGLLSHPSARKRRRRWPRWRCARGRPARALRPGPGRCRRNGRHEICGPPPKNAPGSPGNCTTSSRTM